MPGLDTALIRSEACRNGKTTLTWIWTIALVLLSTCMPIWAATIHVPQDHPTIQRGIDAAQDGDTVLVAPGKYEGVISLRDGITLRGSGDATQLSETVKAVDAERVVIASLHVQGIDENRHFGIFCLNADATIQDVSVRDFHHGISAENSHVSIERCKITNGFNVGIILTQGTEAVIEASTVSDSAVGIIVSATQRAVEIRNSRIEENEVGVECYTADPRLRRSVIAGNFIGLTIDNAAPDLGTESDPGENAILNNRKLAIRYGDKDWLSAQGNWWGQPTGPAADQLDGRVLVDPWLTVDPREGFPVRLHSLLYRTFWGKVRGIEMPVSQSHINPRHTP